MKGIARCVILCSELLFEMYPESSHAHATFAVPNYFAVYRYEPLAGELKILRSNCQLEDFQKCLSLTLVLS